MLPAMMSDDDDALAHPADSDFAVADPAHDADDDDAPDDDAALAFFLQNSHT